MEETSPWETTLNQIFELWVTPEVIRRQEAGKIPQPYFLHSAQIIFYPDSRPHVIRLNDEVQSIAKIKLLKGVKKEAGEMVYSHEVESYESFRLTEEEDPNCGHITVKRLGDHWTFGFDCIYNKGLSRDNLKVADEFWQAARLALEHKSYRVFVDNLFSASELAAKAILLTTPHDNNDARMSHGRIKSRYNLDAKMGNVPMDHKDAFSTLSELRSSARYLNSKFEIDEATADELLDRVKNAIDFANSRVDTTKDQSDDRGRP